jgi:hypothetical protein
MNWNIETWHWSAQAIVAISFWLLGTYIFGKVFDDWKQNKF